MKVRSTILALCAVAAAVAGGHAVAAQRHFVASTGNDINPCSITLPCRSFAAAELLVDPNGEIIVQDTAGYGFVNVTKPLSILSPYGVYAGISVFAGTDGVTINAPGGGVRLTGVYINGQGGSIGIHVLNASRVTVEGSSVTNMASHGFSSTSATARIVIRNTVFRDNGGLGVTITGAQQTTIDAVHADRNALGGFKFDGTSGTVSHSVTNDNGGTGVFVTAPSLSTIDDGHRRSRELEQRRQRDRRAGVQCGRGLRHRLAQRDVGQYAARCARDDLGPGHRADHPLLFGTDGQRRGGGHGGHREPRSSSSTAPRSPRIRSACRACRSASCAAPATTRSPTT